MLQDWIEGAGELFHWTAGAVLMTLWITGIVADAGANTLTWVVVDIFVPPIGMVRGLGSLL